MHSAAVAPSDTPRAVDDSGESGCMKFIEGQYVPEKAAPSEEELAKHCWPAGWLHLVHYRNKLFAVTLMGLLTWAWWFPVMEATQSWHHFNDKYYMTLVMIFGSMIAGGTSEGGASVAFPVMTLVFSIAPAVARDFSLMIQSVGMTAAAFTILYMQVMVERNAMLWTNLGGVIGVCTGLTFVAPNLSPAVTKMAFVSAWFTFAVALFYLNRIRDRPVFLRIPNVTAGNKATLFGVGIIGGVLTSIAGSGIDIASFACLTLVFRISEKTATPTSVVLMATNTVVGFLWQLLVMGVQQESWGFFLVCAPVVCYGAPLGAFLASYIHRLVYAGFVYVTDTVQFVGALIIVKQTATTWLITAMTIVGGIGLFSYAIHYGQGYLDRMLEAELEKNPENVVVGGGKA